MGETHFDRTDNLEVHKEHVVISVNPKIYPLSVVYSAAYAFLAKAYIIIKGNPKEKIIVELHRRSAQQNSEDLGREFNNEIINCLVRTSEFSAKQKINDKVAEPIPPFNEGEYLDDPLRIAKPWEEG